MKYFEGQLSNGKKPVQLISFEPSLHSEEAQKAQRGVALKNCVFKRSRSDGDEFEILVNKKTSITQSPKMFKVGNEDGRPKIVCAVELRTLLWLLRVMGWI